MTAERDVARADLERERRHADVRVADLRSAYEQQIQQLKGAAAANAAAHERKP